MISVNSFQGRLLYCEPPPGVTVDAFNGGPAGESAQGVHDDAGESCSSRSGYSHFDRDFFAQV